LDKAVGMVSFSHASLDSSTNRKLRKCGWSCVESLINNGRV